MSSTAAPRKFRRIATEEAFSIPRSPTAFARWRGRRATASTCSSSSRSTTRPATRPAGACARQLLDLEEQRIRDMDDNGVDVQLMLLTAPGVQMFDADTATDLATIANDRLAELIARHPTRFAGLASFAPHSPKRAAKEMERARQQLKLGGFVVNSHTNGEYLDDQKYWPALEAAEALDGCIYIHPRAPAEGLAALPLLRHGQRNVGLRRGNRHARRAHDPQRRVRPLPETENLPRPHGRRRALLALAHRLHEHARAERRPRAETAVEAERVLQAQLRHHDERPGDRISRWISRSRRSAPTT